MPTDTPVQIWELRHDDRSHLVEVSGSWVHRVSWCVDGQEVAHARSAEGRVRLTPGEDGDLGSVTVRFGALGSPQRATLEQGLLDGGVDLEPESGSPAAAWEDRLRAHPTRHALLAGLAGVARVVVPLLLAILLARLTFSVALPRLDWDLPDLPSVPWPDLPAVPWPDLPSLPRPDLPDWSLPGWLTWVLEHAKYVVPVLVALGLARSEVRRRRAQDELRAARRDEVRSDEA